MQRMIIFLPYNVSHSLLTTVPAMKNKHELEEPILGQLQGLEKKQAYHVYANQWGYAP